MHLRDIINFLTFSLLTHRDPTIFDFGIRRIFPESTPQGLDGSIGDAEGLPGMRMAAHQVAAS